MRSKAPLLLMEQMVMLLVFALAAAICLQAFVKSDGLSGASEDRDRAVTLCQEAAEAVRHSGGDPKHALTRAAELLDTTYGGYSETYPLQINYSADWTRSESREYAYCLRACGLESGVPGLCKALVKVSDSTDTRTLFEIEVAWQVPAASAEVTAEVVAEVEIDDGTAD